jgi:hypothetical protein
LVAALLSGGLVTLAELSTFDLPELALLPQEANVTAAIAKMK